MASRVILDASVAAKWFLKDEEDRGPAINLLKTLLAGRLEVHVPRLFFYEVSNLLTRACAHRNRQTKQPRIDKETARQSLSQLFQLPFQVAPPTEKECLEGLDLATRYSKTFYDMTYVRLAEALDCTWCTADERVLRHWPASSLAHRIVHLPAFRLEPQGSASEPPEE